MCGPRLGVAHPVLEFLVSVVWVHTLTMVDQVPIAARRLHPEPRLSIENETVDVCTGAELVARSVMEHELSPG